MKKVDHIFNLWDHQFISEREHPGIPDFGSGRDLEIRKADHFKFQRRKLKAGGGQMTCLQCSCGK